MDFGDKFDRDYCFSFWNVGIIFLCAGVNKISRRVIRLGQRSPTGQLHQRYSGPSLCCGVFKAWTLGYEFIETYESGVTKCTTGEAWSPFN